MTRQELREYGNKVVTFYDETHEYLTPEGLSLSGVTGRIRAMAEFKNMYGNVPAHVLENARIRGTNVHKNIELHDLGLSYEDLPEVQEWQRLIDKHKINMIGNEFLVSDNELIATMIDGIDDKLNLYDHKRTSTLHKEYLSWQLSAGAYLFEKQTGLKAGKLYAIHHTDKGSKRIEVKRKTDDEVRDMLYTDKYETETTSLLPVHPHHIDEAIRLASDYEAQLIAMKEALKLIDDELKKQKDLLVEYFASNGIDKAESERATFTYVAPYQRDGIDTARLKNEMPEVYQEYYKPSNVKGSVRITLKK